MNFNFSENVHQNKENSNKVTEIIILNTGMTRIWTFFIIFRWTKFHFIKRIHNWYDQ